MVDINTRLLKAGAGGGTVGGGLPFQNYGAGWGAASIYSSWASWDAALDRMYPDAGTSRINWAARAGDPTTSRLMMALYRFLSNVLPEAPLQVRKKEGGQSGVTGQSEPVADHPMVALWNQPNKFYSGSTLMKGLAFSWATRSEAYILKAVNTVGEVLELWYEPPWSIRPVWPIDGSEYISYYEVNRNGTWYPVEREYVVHLRDGFHPYNQRIGFETSVAILPELAGDKEAAYYYANLMSGSGVPPFIVGIDPQTKMNDVQARQLQQRLVQGTTGDKKGEPVVIAGGKAYRLGFTPRELNLEETRYMPEDSFCAVKGCPAVVLELGAGRANSIYNNVQAAEERAWRSYVKPLLRHIREELTSQLLVDFEDVDEQGRITTGAYLEHDFSEVQALQEDRDAKAKRIGQLCNDGVIMLSEARSEMGYGPSDGKNWERDKIFRVSRGVTLVKPGEQPLPQGEQIIDMTTGKVTREAQAPTQPPSPFGPTPAQPGVSPTEEQTAKSIRARIAEARRLRALPPAPPESNGNGHHRLEL